MDSDMGGHTLEDISSNPIIVEKISRYLNEVELVNLGIAWPDVSSKMDVVCWRKRAKRLESVLRRDDPDNTTFKDKYFRYKPRVQMIVAQMTDKINECHGVISINCEDLEDLEYFEGDPQQYFSPEELADIASLVHHNMLGEVDIKTVEFWDCDLLSNQDPHHLESLAAKIQDGLAIFREEETENKDVSSLLDKINCKIDFMMEIDSTQALIQSKEKLSLIAAMNSRVPKVTFYYGTADAQAVLRSYDGKGACQEVQLITRDNEESRQCSKLRILAQKINWLVDIKETDHPSSNIEITITGQQI